MFFPSTLRRKISPRGCSSKQRTVSAVATESVFGRHRRVLSTMKGDQLMVMPANNSSSIVHYWAGKYPGCVGWLVGPSAMVKTKLRPWMPFALDNDAFASWTTGRPWDETSWYRMLEAVRASGLSPRWVLVPDVVSNRAATLDKWAAFAPVAKQFGWPLAMAVQDGMTPQDVPSGADVIFVGGTTDWKWSSLAMWAKSNRRIHVGRVNEVKKLAVCEAFGVESVDGTGWMRGTSEGRQAKDLASWLAGEYSQSVKDDWVSEYIDSLL